MKLQSSPDFLLLIAELESGLGRELDGGETMIVTEAYHRGRKDELRSCAANLEAAIEKSQREQEAQWLDVLMAGPDVAALDVTMAMGGYAEVPPAKEDDGDKFNADFAG